MKQRASNPVIPDYTPRTERKKPEEPKAREAQKCLMCPTMTLGWGMFSEGAVCSLKCNKAHMEAKSTRLNTNFKKGGDHVSIPEREDPLAR